MTLTDAISAVESANSTYTNAVNTTTNDKAAAAAIQAKLDAANATVVQDQATQDSAALSFNSTLQGLIDAATAAMIPVNTQPAQPTPIAA